MLKALTTVPSTPSQQFSSFSKTRSATSVVLISFMDQPSLSYLWQKDICTVIPILHHCNDLMLSQSSDKWFMVEQIIPKLTKMLGNCRNSKRGKQASHLQYVNVPSRLKEFQHFAITKRIIKCSIAFIKRGIGEAWIQVGVIAVLNHGQERRSVTKTNEVQVAKKVVTECFSWVIIEYVPSHAICIFSIYPLDWLRSHLSAWITTSEMHNISVSIHMFWALQRKRSEWNRYWIITFPEKEKNWKVCIR